MESSNNNLNALDPNEEHDGENIDTLDLLINYQSDCVGNALKAQDRKVDKDDEETDHHYVTNNPLGELDKNVSFSETKIPGQDESKHGHPISMDRRTSSVRKLKTIYDNTYRMEPKPDQYFVSYKVRAQIASLVSPMFTNFEYESKAAANLCKLICNKVLHMLKKKSEFPRYRYVCLATIAELKQQGMIIGERCLWNTAFDSVAAYTLENKSAVLVVTLHGIYFE